jgi:predicted MFS family arabinose efflux permease
VLFATAFAFMAAAAFGIFNRSMPVAGVAALATASLGITGMLPASIYASAPRFAPQPELLALTVGIVVQMSHLGHVIGPSALGAWVEKFGWSSSPAPFAAIACGGLAVALGVRRLTRPQRVARMSGAICGAGWGPPLRAQVSRSASAMVRTIEI